LLYHNRNNQPNAHSHSQIPSEPTCKTFSQWCCLTFKSHNICVFQNSFLPLDFRLAAPNPLTTAPTQAFPTKLLGQTRALQHTMYTAHSTELKAMSQTPLPVTPNITPATTINDIEPRALVTEQGICLTLELSLLNYDPFSTHSGCDLVRTANQPLSEGHNSVNTEPYPTPYV